MKIKHFKFDTVWEDTTQQEQFSTANLRQTKKNFHHREHRIHREKNLFIAKSKRLINYHREHRDKTENTEKKFFMAKNKRKTNRLLF